MIPKLHSNVPVLTCTREEETVDESKNLEFISSETVQEIVLWIYRTSLRLQSFLKDVFSW